MARARLIKPSFFTNEDVVRLPAETQLLFIGLWTLADREGRIEDRPLRIKMQIFPAASYDVNGMLGELHAAGLLIRYEVEGQKYLWIPTFIKHQHPHPNEAPSVIPAYDQNANEQCNITSEQDQDTSGRVITHTARSLPSFPSIPSDTCKDTPSECLAVTVETDRTAGPPGAKAKSRKKAEVSEKAAWAEAWLSVFEDAYQLTHQCPYKRKTADFVQLAALVRGMPEQWLTPERFIQAVQNYFSSDIGTHTLADLATRFGDFYRSPLDRFKVPIKRPESVNGAPTKRETENERNRRENAEYLAALDRAAAGTDLEAPASVTGNSRSTSDDERRGPGLDGKLLEPRFG